MASGSGGFPKNVSGARAFPSHRHQHRLCIRVGAKSNAETFKDQQQLLADLMVKGAVVIVCPFCAKHYGIETTDLIEGAKVSNPDLTGGLLFKDDTKTLTW